MILLFLDQYDNEICGVIEVPNDFDVEKELKDFLESKAGIFVDDLPKRGRLGRSPEKIKELHDWHERCWQGESFFAYLQKRGFKKIDSQVVSLWGEPRIAQASDPELS